MRVRALLMVAAATCLVGAPAGCASGGSSGGGGTGATTAAGAGGTGAGEGGVSSTTTSSQGGTAEAGAGGVGGGVGGGVSSGGNGGGTGGGTGGEPPPPAELIAWYRFEEPNNPVVVDSSLYGHDGVASAGVTRGVGGRFGLGVRFDGSTSNIDIPYSAELDITGDITIEAWVYLDAPVGYNRMLVRKYLQYQLSVSVAPQPSLLEFYSQPLGFARTTEAVDYARWVHVAASHDGTTALLYFDGVLADAVPHAGAKPSNNSGLKLGGDGLNQSAPDGGMDEVKVWNVVRSEQQICEDGGGSYDSNGSPTCQHSW